MAHHARPRPHPKPRPPRQAPRLQVQPAQDNQPTVDYSGDPVLAMIRAQQQQNIAAAESANLAARQQALISYGYSPELSGLYPDQNTQNAAQQNSFSTLNDLKRNHEQRQKGLNEDLNKANLFYSSTRGQELQKEGTQYLGEQSDAAGKLRDYLSSLNENLLGAKQGSEDAISQGEQDAYLRNLQNSLQYGGLPPAKHRGARYYARRARHR